jgi:phosphoribosylformylglycinamidine cyclo-ligase
MSAAANGDAGVRFGPSEQEEQPASSRDELMPWTFSERVVPDVGGFAALLSLDHDERLFRHNYAHPILASVTHGAGTKLKVAFMTGRHDAVGMDLVASCANDVLTLGAEPLFFLDYVVTDKPEQDALRQLAAGIVTGCRQAGCALLGGRTCEEPALYGKGGYSAAGFMVGVVEKHRIIAGDRMRPGDMVVGLASNGLHVCPPEGDLLLGRLFFDEAGMRCSDSLARFGIERTLGEELLTPMRIYVRAVRFVLHRYTVKQVVAAIVHVAAGGLFGSIARLLPEGCAVELGSANWQRPRIFEVLRQLGDVPMAQMYGMFNMGIGMVLVVAPYYAESVVRQLRREGEEAAIIGRVVEGPKQVSVS